MDRLRVLVAEHQWLVGAQLQGQLERLRHRVVGWARDGREGVEAAVNLEPDLVVADIQLPVLNGIEMTRAILAARPVPVVLLTGYTAADLVRRARQAGVMAWLSRPVERTQLSRAIEVALARFGEFETLRREAGDLDAALARRLMVEQAKRVLMKRRGLSEAEAFRWIQEESRRASAREVASLIVHAEDLLLRRVNFPRGLHAVLAGIRWGLSRGSMPRGVVRDPVTDPALGG